MLDRSSPEVPQFGETKEPRERTDGLWSPDRRTVKIRRSGDDKPGPLVHRVFMRTASVPAAPLRGSPRRRRWIGRAVAATGVTAVLAFDRSPAVGLAALFLIIVPFEKLFPRHRQKVRRAHLGTDMAYALVSGPLATIGVVVGVVVSVVSLWWIPGLMLRPLVGAMPTVPRGLLGIALFDLAIYWAHRFGHEVPFLWRFHRIHHSTEHLDWVSGFRNHPLDGVLVAPAFVLLLAAGFSARFSGALLVIQFATGLFLHANVRWRWRWLQKIVITPEFHHWHHANMACSRNTNYSPLLPLWDLVFHTYAISADDRPTVYGVDGGVPAGILAQLWEPMQDLRNPWPMLRHPRSGLRELRTMAARGVRQMVASARHRSVTG